MLTTRTFKFGKYFLKMLVEAMTSRVGVSPAQASTKSGLLSMSLLANAQIPNPALQ